MILYYLTIRPLEILLEIIYAVSARLLGTDWALAIIALSLAVNLMLLPLYNRAEKVQKEQAEIEKRLSVWATHIRKTFHGDERFMMLNAYYRENSYSPIYALRGSLTLLLEIPFFIAAYRFLSGVTYFRAVSFGPIQLLSAPDALLQIGGVTINVLPIIMTLINIVSTLLYAKGMPKKSVMQLFAMAGIFLVLLYRSPSALVLYWTYNNLFSLVKNLFYQSKEPLRVLSVIASIGGIAMFLTLVIGRVLVSKRQILFVAGICIAMQIPLVYRLFRKYMKEYSRNKTTETGGFFVICMAYLTLLIGILIPVTVISDSPIEFVSIVNYINPLTYLVSVGSIAAGLFLVWGSVFYYIADPIWRRRLSIAFFAVAIVFTVNYMFFGTELGPVNNDLNYAIAPHFSSEQILINMLTVVVLAIIAVFLKIYCNRLAIAICTAMIVGACVLSITGIIRTQKELRETAYLQTGEIGGMASDIQIPLSRNGKNVIVMMLDRAIGAYVPFVFAEKPELHESMSGFTFYPNTISFAGGTVFGAPALFGGYEYTPEAMNKRDDVLLKDKHNEALKLLPTLFVRDGFKVTVSDPPYANYQWVPDLTIFDDMPEVTAFITEGKFADDLEETQDLFIGLRERNFFCYSFLKTFPLIFSESIYNDGYYNRVIRSDISVNKFAEAYSVLKRLPLMTKTIDQSVGTYTAITNNTTHEGQRIQAPDYDTMMTDGGEYDRNHMDRFTLNGVTIQGGYEHYETTVATFLRLGEWFDYMKEKGVYDNTRIILVADHGYAFNQFEHMIFENGPDVEGYNPLLMVKDFESDGILITDNTFMTNADVPILATENLIDDPVNPFTGNPISNEQKFNQRQLILTGGDWEAKHNTGTSFETGNSLWWAVEKDIFDPNNWTAVEAPK